MSTLQALRDKIQQQHEELMADLTLAEDILKQEGRDLVDALVHFKCNKNYYEDLIDALKLQLENYPKLLRALQYTEIACSSVISTDIYAGTQDLLKMATSRLLDINRKFNVLKKFCPHNKNIEANYCNICDERV